MKVERTAAADQVAQHTLDEHRALITAKRRLLDAELAAAALCCGDVTVLAATPGLGKTHAAAEVANKLHGQQMNVAIVVASHELAEREWVSRLTNPFVWQSRQTECTCYDRAYLAAVTRLGYALPECQADCPYMQQYADREGCITIYQHHHLHLNRGEILEGVDVIIVDESPLPALLEEERRSQDELRRLINRCGRDGQPDPAVPLLRALHAVGRKHKRCEPSLRGPELLTAIAAELPMSLVEAIATADMSLLAQEHRPADGTTPPEQLPPLFLGRLLRALKHDARPDTPNTLLAWNGVSWSWFKRHTLLKGFIGSDTAPAVLVLDGSANSAIAERLYAPWPVEVISIDVPLSPLVTVVQCPKTASTRRIVQDRKTLDSVTRAVMAVCNHLDILIDGGISYLKAEQQLTEQLGGTWLHYGGQRGSNALQDARMLAIIASPTTPPDAIERKALALWSFNPVPIVCGQAGWEWVGKGDYRARDARLEAMSRMHGLEELRQAAHRCRPISSTKPTTLLIFSPWDVAAIGFTPSLVVTDVPHGNSTNSAQAAAQYAARRSAVATSESEHADHCDDFQSPLINSVSLPTIENVQSDPPQTAPPISRSSNDGFENARRDPQVRPSLIERDDPWVAYQEFMAERERLAGNIERAALHQRNVDRARGVA